MPKKQSVRSNRICFTLNNYKEEECQGFLDFSKDSGVSFMIVGKEKGEKGTPHLQGFIHLKTSKLKAKDGTVSKWKSMCPALQRAHLESAFGTDEDSKKYCEKEGDLLVEIGSPQTNTSIWTQLANITDVNEAKEIDPECYVKYINQLEKIAFRNKQINRERPKICLRYWQNQCQDYLMAQDDRKILFIVDYEGGCGKSTMAKYLMAEHNAFLCNGGKSADLGLAALNHGMDENKIVVFDMARCNDVDYFPWNFMEQLKNGYYISPKYVSRKVECESQKIVVFMNELPPIKFSLDRYEVYTVEKFKTAVPGHFLKAKCISNGLFKE